VPSFGSAQMIWGGRVTIPAGITVILISGAIGILVGAIAGYFAGILDEALMRITELFMAFPPIILALAITAALSANVGKVGPGSTSALNPNTKIRNAVIAIVVVFWPSYARLMRGLVIQVKNRDYVEATRSIGASHAYILFRTILPNCIAPAIILMTLDIGNAILVFAGLSFLGLGPDPSKPEWGRMVSAALDFDLFNQWWMWTFPGLAIAILVMAFNFVGDGVRDMTDPKMRH
jgi:peptide/nickel transport system permease protein